MTMHVGATLRLLRLEAGVSLRDLARRIGVSSAYLSRVENGIDPVPTAERLHALAKELDVPAALLVEPGQRIGDLVQRYAEEQPLAGALLLELARLRLDDEELVQLHRYVTTRIRRPSAQDDAKPSLERLLTPERIALQLVCADAMDLFDVAGSKLAAVAGAGAGELAQRFAAREASEFACVGGGVAISSLVRPVRPAASLVTLREPLTGPEGRETRCAVFLITPRADRDHLAMVAHVARLGWRGLAESVGALRQPAAVLARIRDLEELA